MVPQGNGTCGGAGQNAVWAGWQQLGDVRELDLAEFRGRQRRRFLEAATCV